MNTEQHIAKRAKKYALSIYPDMRDDELQSYSDCRRDYVHGARDQCRIDIDKACLAFSKFLDYLLESGRISLQDREDCEWCDTFYKAMEE